MQYLSLENVTRSYGDKVLFKNVNLSISKGDKIVLVIKNGRGKTTLLKVIGGEEGSDGKNAKIITSKEIKTAILKQDPFFDPKATVLETIFDSDLLDFLGCMIIVTHDRYFMDKLVDHLFILEGNAVLRDYNGTYSDYRDLQKAEEKEKHSVKAEIAITQPEKSSKGKASFK